MKKLFCQFKTVVYWRMRLSIGGLHMMHRFRIVSSDRACRVHRLDQAAA